MPTRASPAHHARGTPRLDADRVRILSAAVELASEHGPWSATGDHVVGRAGMCRRPSVGQPEWLFERQARRSRVRWLRLIVWAIVLLWCMLVWAGVYLGYVAAGGPLP